VETVLANVGEKQLVPVGRREGHGVRHDREAPGPVGGELAVTDDLAVAQVARETVTLEVQLQGQGVDREHALENPLEGNGVRARSGWRGEEKRSSRGGEKE